MHWTHMKTRFSSSCGGFVNNTRTMTTMMMTMMQVQKLKRRTTTLKTLKRANSKLLAPAL
jgi:hypothetical protein